MLDIHGHDMTERTAYTIVLAGRLDSRTAREFQLFQEELVESGRYFLILDARSLSYVSSSGIASLLSLVRRLQGRGAAVLLAPNQEVRLLLEFFALTDYLPIVTTEAEAQAYLSRQAAALGPELSLRTGEGIALPPVSAELPSPGAGNGVPDLSTSAASGETGGRSRPHAIPRQSPVQARPLSAVSSAAQPAEPNLSELREQLRDDLRRIVQEELAPMKAVGGAASGAADSADATSAAGLSAASDSRAGSTSGVGSATAPASAPERKGPKMPALERPEVVRCEQCGGQFRVRSVGRHQCPHCRVEVRVDSSGRAAFGAG